jgi:hypothetical protein
MSSLISALFLRWNAQVGGDQSQYDPADQVAETSDQHPVALEASPALWIGQGNPRLDREIDELAFVGTYGLPRLHGFFCSTRRTIGAYRFASAVSASAAWAAVEGPAVRVTMRADAASAWVTMRLAAGAAGAAGRRDQIRAVKRRKVPGTPSSSCSPRSSKVMPEPATRSLTVLDTTTSPGRAAAAVA